MSVIEKYRENVSKRQYALRKLRSIDLFYWQAADNGFKDSVIQAKGEFREFRLWKDMGIRKTLGFLYRFLDKKLNGRR